MDEGGPTVDANRWCCRCDGSSPGTRDNRFCWRSSSLFRRGTASSGRPDTRNVRAPCRVGGDEDLAKRGSQVCGIDRIKNGPHLGVGGDAIDPIDGAEVVVGVAAALIEGQQGRVFEREHREGRHQGVVQGDFDLAERWSGREPKWERRTWKRASAERSLRASPGASAMVSHSVGPSGKMGNSEKHYARRICEMGDQNKRLFRGKTVARELLQPDRLSLPGLFQPRTGRKYIGWRRQPPGISTRATLPRSPEGGGRGTMAGGV